ncbi:DUSP domain protein (macronuclear) [Tetrahymena thermophila SB210]|uniref:DUSP domain protein n=1 Tax=Tetrahymena thermophila (strain SB210) TaxID=312017 RepID=I7MCH2_TETTS|nr:DUSP domain protein [Tetrahymena thermophila SB210]EAR83941.1 DUSP domain protein [Tetrahymena thermophila SB210]|eukprot:XP_001031604.1 DUSP domain protein [Tetrahymena thermophila SB210]
MKGIKLQQYASGEEKTQMNTFYCLICNQEASNRQLVDFQKPSQGQYQEQIYDRIQANNIYKTDNAKQHYINIFCQDCEQKFNTQENQLDIFRKLIGFFEDSRYQSSQECNNNQAQVKDQKKLKIKDLIRLIMHMFNEITGIAQIVYSSFLYNPILQNSLQQEKNLIYNSKLQKFICEHQKYSVQNESKKDSFLDKDCMQINQIAQDECLEADKEGQDKKFINNFYMDSPFTKAPKRKFKQQSVDIQDTQLDSLKYTANNRKQQANESDRFCLFSASQDFLQQRDQEINQKVNKSVEQIELNLLSKKPKQNSTKPNIPQLPSKRYQGTHKSVGNSEQMQKLKSTNANNTLNISIQSNIDFGNNSFFTQSPSVIHMMGTQSSQNQSITNNNNKLFQEFHSSKNSAQQILFGEGPASKKLLDIKQSLQKQINQSSNYLNKKNNLQKLNNHSSDQIQTSQLQKANIIKRSSLILNDSKPMDKKKIELNHFQFYSSNNIQNEQFMNENTNQVLINCNSQNKKIKNDLKNSSSQLPVSQNSSQNCVNSTNYISNKSKSSDGSALENVQLTERASSSMNVTTVQNEMQANNIQDVSSIQGFINLACEGSPQTPTNQSEINISQYKDFYKNENQNQALGKDKKPELSNNIPKTLKYRKTTSNQNVTNNILFNQENVTQDQQILKDDEDCTMDKKYKFYKFGFNSSNDNSIMGGLKSLNNSVNMSYLNKTIINDNNLSQSTIMNNSKYHTTTPIQEKIIIKSLMKSEYGSNFNNSGFHFERVGVINEAKYIISAQWWREWMEYVGFNESAQCFQESDIQIRKERPKKLKNKCLLKGEQLYNFKNTKNIELKENLLEHYDYEAVPKSIFCYIKMWYGVDYEIIRFLKYDASQPVDKSVYLDLYPEKILAFSLPIGIRKRSKNSTIGSTNTEKTNNLREGQTQISQSNKTLPSKANKNEKLSLTENNISSTSLSRANKYEDKRTNQKNRNHQSLDIDKISVTMIDSNKKTVQNEQNDTIVGHNSQRSVAQEKSKACNIF